MLQKILNEQLGIIGISPTEFAKRLGDSPGWVSRVLNGKDGLSHKKVARWATVLSLNEKYLRELAKRDKIDRMKADIERKYS